MKSCKDCEFVIKEIGGYYCNKYPDSLCGFPTRIDDDHVDRDDRPIFCNIKKENTDENI